MAVDAWMMDASGGAPSYTAGEVRLTTVTPFMAGAGASLGALSGVRPSGSGADLLVQAQGSPNMSVLVNTGTIIVQGTISVTQGAYTWALDTATTLVIATAHGILARTDLVCVRIRDAGVDTSGQRDAAVTVITGTAGAGVPSLPTDATYLTIAQIAVPAAVTTITTARITDKRPFTAALGGTIRCTSTTRPTGVELGQRIYESDTTLTRIWTGSIWRLDGDYRDTQLVTVAQATVTFSNIPKTLRKIHIGLTARLDTDGRIYLRINGDTTGGRYRSQLWNAFTAGTNNTSDITTNAALVAFMPAGGLPGDWGGGSISITGWDAPHPDYLTGTATAGYVFNTTGGSSDAVVTWAYTGPSASGYTSISLTAAVGVLQPGSQFVLTGSE